MWWHNWRHLVHLKDEALNTLGYLIEQVPIAPERRGLEESERSVAELCCIHTEVHESRRLLAGWYRQGWDIERIPEALRDPFALTAEQFVAAIRRVLPRGRRMTAAAIEHIHQEYARSVAPTARRLAEAARHERVLNRLVNEAYGLSPEEVALMWRTAPPRMPVPAPVEAGAGASGPAGERSMVS